jgi:hypothetical protein
LISVGVSGRKQPRPFLALPRLGEVGLETVLDKRLRHLNSQSARLRRNDRDRRKLGFMTHENFAANGGLLTSGNADQPKNATVRPTAQHGQLAEIFIQRHKHPALIVGNRKNFFVTRIARPITGPHDIMPSHL